MIPTNFRIRTITAGVTLSDLSDTASILTAIEFLEGAKSRFTESGYEVQTLRIATQNFHEYLNGTSYSESLAFLKRFDELTKGRNVILAIGQVLPPNVYRDDIAKWAVDLINQTEVISFSLPISSSDKGVLNNSIKAAAEITVAIANNSKGGEGNFRFTASANCPANIPFFPAAFHSGPKSFAIGLEYPNLLTVVFKVSNRETAAANLKAKLESTFVPIENIATELSKNSGWIYDGLDTSPAPGLDASIGEAIEAFTSQPFGEASTLSACAMITGVIKGLSLKTCGYSGLMLPVIEDKVLAKRATENRFTLQELLLYSTVSGTGLDVIPIPGNTTKDVIERIYGDVASLSLKYTNKALSARLFLIPDKEVGESVDFDNPYLTSSVVMKAE